MSVVSDILGIITGVAEGFTHNLIGLAIVGVIAFFVYLKWGKPKPVNMAEVIFKKQYEATAERLKLLKPKKLGLCSYPMSAAELKNNIHQIKHDIIGNVIGINVVGVRTNVKTLVKLARNFSEKEVSDFLETNKEYIDKDKFWLVFAVERQIGGRFLFPKVSKALIYCKPPQIIDMNSNDDVIRVRGFGITSQGAGYEIINDENTILNINQLALDTSNIMEIETGLSMVSRLGDYSEAASKLDSETRKTALLSGLHVLNPPVSQEVKT
jgi:hypothetical protein